MAATVATVAAIVFTLTQKLTDHVARSLLNYPAA